MSSGREAAPSPQVVHPAVLGAKLRFGRVGGREAAATVVHLIGLGFLECREVEIQGTSWGRPSTKTTLELKLVKGCAPHSRGTKTIVNRGHIDGLTKIDRQLLSIMFDRIAHSDTVTVAQIDAFSARHRYSYWVALSGWRRLVEEEAKRSNVGRKTVVQLRRETRLALRTASQAGSASMSKRRLRVLAVLFGLDRRFGFPLARPDDVSPSDGLTLGLHLYGLRSSFSPYNSMGFAPAQSVGISLPSYGSGGGSAGAGGGGGFSGGGGSGGGGGGGGAD